MTRQAKGAAGENQVEEYLSRLQYRVLERNFRVPEGEIDRVMLAPDGKTVCFVEVKTRADEKFTPAETALTAAKRARMVKAASAYLVRRDLSHAPVRFDFAVVLEKSPVPEIRYYPGAFEIS